MWLVEQFFLAKTEDDRRQLPRWDLLSCYAERWRRWHLQLTRRVGCFFGVIRVRDPCEVWKGLNSRAGGAAQTNRILADRFGLTLLGRYLIHARATFSA